MPPRAWLLAALRVALRGCSIRRRALTGLLRRARLLAAPGVARRGCSVHRDMPRGVLAGLLRRASPGGARLWTAPGAALAAPGGARCGLGIRGREPGTALANIIRRASGARLLLGCASGTPRPLAAPRAGRPLPLGRGLPGSWAAIAGEPDDVSGRRALLLPATTGCLPARHPGGRGGRGGIGGLRLTGVFADLAVRGPWEVRGVGLGLRGLVLIGLLLAHPAEGLQPLLHAYTGSGRQAEGVAAAK
mmetsp:Transcript_6550/g.19910  ORF Transcript_6550/g.19910 Transcript_6550/m.19910 type:complete len:247 (+) Transcript_6550:1020-1760(+)